MIKEIDKIQRILFFLERNYNRHILPKEIEDITNYSYRNAQRIFKKIFKETIGEFQIRLRLENGFKELIYSNNSITDISFSIGYESNQAFTKAFKKKYLITPNEARTKKEDFFSNFITNSKKTTIKSKILIIPEIEVYSKLIITNDYDNPTINSLWDKIYDLTNQSYKYKYYGVIVDQPLLSLKTKSRYEACFTKLSENFKEFNSKKILGRKYIQYTHYGGYDTILDTYRLIYFDWLYNQAYEIDTNPIIEYYQIGHDTTTEEKEFITQILVPCR